MVDAVCITSVQGQALDFFRDDLCALHGLWQQAAIAGADCRVLELQRADLQNGFRNLGFAGQAQRGPVTRRFVAVGARHKSAAASVFAGVQLHTLQAKSIDTESYGAFGVTGLDTEQKALAPFFLLALTGIFAVITVEIEVTQFQTSLGVFDEGGLSHGWDSQCCSQSGEGHAPGDGGLEHFLFLLVG